MSTRVSGWASRSFIIGIRLCPPARIRASGPNLASRAIACSPVPVTPRGSRIDLPVRNLVMFSSLGMEKLPHEGYTWRRQAFGSLGDGAPWRQTADEPRLRLAGHLGLCGILKAP